MAQVLDEAPFSLLIVTQGQWGERIAENVSRFRPEAWKIARWAAPKFLPPVIDDPTDFLPARLAPANLLLALGETAPLAQLIPDLVRLCNAQAVIAPIDRNESLPPGLIQQLRGWLTVPVVFPKPFCSLTETTYNLPPIVAHYDNAHIRRFAQQFGQPRLQVAVGDNVVTNATVARDSACGCARFVADGLRGVPVAEAEYQAGMLHHHFPCLASMNQDNDYGDTLMHVSGHLLRAEVKAQVAEYLEPPTYLRPQGRVE